jgi:hypothetical protein
MPKSESKKFTEIRFRRFPARHVVVVDDVVAPARLGVADVDVRVELPVVVAREVVGQEQRTRRRRQVTIPWI